MLFVILAVPKITAPCDLVFVKLCCSDFMLKVQNCSKAFSEKNAMLNNIFTIIQHTAFVQFIFCLVADRWLVGLDILL